MSDTRDGDLDTDLLLAALGLGDVAVDLLEVATQGARPLRPARSTATGTSVVVKTAGREVSGGNQYRARLAKISLLTGAQEQELAKAIEAGVLAEDLLTTPRGALRRRELEAVAAAGRAAFELMLVSNLRLVYHWAVRHQGRGLELDDLVQEGTLGLVRAVQKFDYATGYKFSTYATWWIKQALGRAVADQGRTVRLPVHVWERVVKVRRVQADSGADLDDRELRSLIAATLDMDVEEVHQVLMWSRRSWSLDELLEHDVLDQLEDDDVRDPVEEVEMRRGVHRALLRLPERTRVIMERRFGIVDGVERTLDEVGREFGLTRERIRQLESKAKAALKEDPFLVACRS